LFPRATPHAPFPARLESTSLPWMRFMPKSSRVIVAAACTFVFLLAGVRAQRAAAASRPGTRSLLQNPDFERGQAQHPWMPSGWDTSMADLPTVFFGRDSFIVHGGKWAVNVANMSGAFP